MYSFIHFNEEADESLYWLEVAREAALVPADSGVDVLMKEANALVSIFNATDIAAKKNKNK